MQIAQKIGIVSMTSNSPSNHDRKSVAFSLFSMVVLLLLLILLAETIIMSNAKSSKILLLKIGDDIVQNL